MRSHSSFSMLSLNIFPNVLELRGHGKFRGLFKAISEEELFQSSTFRDSTGIVQGHCEEQPFDLTDLTDLTILDDPFVKILFWNWVRHRVTGLPGGGAHQRS